MFRTNNRIDKIACSKAANEWLVTRKQDLEKLYKEYVTRTFLSADAIGTTSDWITAETIVDLVRRRNEHRKYVFEFNTRLMTYTEFFIRVCDKMHAEVRNFLLLKLRSAFSLN